MKIFEGKKAVVIGGSGAIGKSIAAMLCKNGARVLIQGKTASKLEKAAEYIKVETGAEVEVFQCDFSEVVFEKKIETIIKTVLQSTDILCVCYGPFLQADLHKMTAEQWKNIALLDYALPGMLVSSVLNYMTEKGWGRILLFGGTGTNFRSEYKTNAAYAGAKTGIGVLVQSTAACYGNNGITCNGILPGFVETEYINTETKHLLEEKIPGKTLISPDSIAKSAEFLLSNKDLNGVLLKIDRGWSPVTSNLA